MTTKLYKPIKNPSAYTFIHTFDSAQEIEDFMKNYDDHPISEAYKKLTRSNKDLTVDDVFKGKSLCSSADIYKERPLSNAALTDQDKHYFVFYSDFNMESPYYVFDVNVNLSPPAVESDKIYNGRFSGETVLEVLSDKDKKSLLLGLLLCTMPEEAVELAKVYYPQYDYKEEINNYLKGKHECFIYPLAKEGDDNPVHINDDEFDEDESDCVDKVFYTSCCKHPIKRKYFMDVIRKNKGCPSCKATVATNTGALRGSLIFDLNDLDFKECYQCRRLNAIGFTFVKDKATGTFHRNYVCPRHYTSRFDEYMEWEGLHPSDLSAETDIVSDSLVINMDHVLDKMIGDKDDYDEDDEVDYDEDDYDEDDEDYDEDDEDNY